jgi:hypothetical protein
VARADAEVLARVAQRGRGRGVLAGLRDEHAAKVEAHHGAELAQADTQAARGLRGRERSLDARLAGRPAQRGGAQEREGAAQRGGEGHRARRRRRPAGLKLGRLEAEHERLRRDAARGDDRPGAGGRAPGEVREGAERGAAVWAQRKINAPVRRAVEQPRDRGEHPAEAGGRRRRRAAGRVEDGDGLLLERGDGRERVALPLV